MQKAFTILELIITMIVLGILVAIGLVQYGKMMEKSRQAEAKMALGSMRQLAYQYYLENGTFVGISSADIGIGSGSIPGGCVSTNYFNYGFQGASATSVTLLAHRCQGSAKTPQWTGDNYVIEEWLYPTGSNPEAIATYDYVTASWCNGFCVPPF